MEFKGLTSASHMSLREAGYGSEEGQLGLEISGAVWTPLDHRTLAGLLLLLGQRVFPLRLHSWHLPSEPKINLLSVLTVAIGIDLEFIPVLIVV